MRKRIRKIIECGKCNQKPTNAETNAENSRATSTNENSTNENSTNENSTNENPTNENSTNETRRMRLDNWKLAHLFLCLSCCLIDCFSCCFIETITSTTFRITANTLPLRTVHDFKPFVPPMLQALARLQITKSWTILQQVSQSPSAEWLKKLTNPDLSDTPQGRRLNPTRDVTG